MRWARARGVCVRGVWASLIELFLCACSCCVQVGRRKASVCKIYAFVNGVGVSLCAACVCACNSMYPSGACARRRACVECVSTCVGGVRDLMQRLYVHAANHAKSSTSPHSRINAFLLAPPYPPLALPLRRRSKTHAFNNAHMAQMHILHACKHSVPTALATRFN